MLAPERRRSLHENSKSLALPEWAWKYSPVQDDETAFAGSVRAESLGAGQLSQRATVIGLICSLALAGA